MSDQVANHKQLDLITAKNEKDEGCFSGQTFSLGSMQVLEQTDSQKLLLPHNQSGGADSNNLDSEGEKHKVICGIADILKAKLNSQGNESFTFGLEKSDSRQSLSNNEGLSHSMMNDGDNPTELVGKTFRESRPIQRQRSGYDSPPRAPTSSQSPKLHRWSTSRSPSDFIMSLNPPLPQEEAEDDSEESRCSKDGVTFSVKKLKRSNPMKYFKNRSRLKEDEKGGGGGKSPSTFKQKYMIMKEPEIITDAFELSHTHRTESGDDNHQRKDWVNFQQVKSGERIIKSKVALKQYREIRDIQSPKITCINPPKLTSNKTQKVFLPPTPEKSNSFKKSPKYSGISIDLQAEEKNPSPVAQCLYSKFKQKANSHEFLKNERPDQPVSKLNIEGFVEKIERAKLIAQKAKVSKEYLTDQHGRVTAQQIKLAMVERAKKMTEGEGVSENTDADIEKSLFSEFSDLKRSPRTRGIQSTTRSMVAPGQNNLNYGRNRQKALNNVSTIPEVSVSLEAGCQKKPKQSYALSILNSKVFLLSALFIVAIIEGLVLILLHEDK